MTVRCPRPFCGQPIAEHKASDLTRVSCLARYVDAVLTGADPRDIARARDHADRLDAAGLHDEAHELRALARHNDDGEATRR